MHHRISQFFFIFCNFSLQVIFINCGLREDCGTSHGQRFGLHLELPRRRRYRCDLLLRRDQWNNRLGRRPRGSRYPCLFPRLTPPSLTVYFDDASLSFASSLSTSETPPPFLLHQSRSPRLTSVLSPDVGIDCIQPHNNPPPLASRSTSCYTYAHGFFYEGGRETS